MLPLWADNTARGTHHQALPEACRWRWGRERRRRQTAPERVHDASALPRILKINIGQREHRGEWSDASEIVNLVGVRQRVIETRSAANYGVLAQMMRKTKTGSEVSGNAMRSTRRTARVTGVNQSSGRIRIKLRFLARQVAGNPVLGVGVGEVGIPADAEIQC